MEIPNFPELSLTLLQGEWKPSDDEKEVPRTSGESDFEFEVDGREVGGREPLLRLNRTD